MDGWDIALLVLAGYLAVVALVRLMIRRRDQLLRQLELEVKQAQRAKVLAEAKQAAESNAKRAA